MQKVGKIFPLPLSESKPISCFGLNFRSRVGLAAGLDKNGDYIDALASVGFGFIEIGTVTPQPQWGHPPPRLFRLTKQEAIINRMGFNNKGLDYVVSRLEKTRYRGILGINIGKNRDTPLEKAVDDYCRGFQALWKFASYITINVSSPNTQGLRDLQQTSYLVVLLRELKKIQAHIAHTQKKYVPLVIKIAPDLSQQALYELAAILVQEQMDGVIATNTTLSREGVENSPYAKEAGGLSGRPLQQRSTQIIKDLRTCLPAKMAIIGVGGIMDKASAEAKWSAGANLIQLYTGFIFHGPKLINASLRSKPA